jgi:hypothetical protein
MSIASQPYSAVASVVPAPSAHHQSTHPALPSCRSVPLCVASSSFCFNFSSLLMHPWRVSVPFATNKYRKYQLESVVFGDCVQKNQNLRGFFAGAAHEGSQPNILRASHRRSGYHAGEYLTTRTDSQPQSIKQTPSRISIVAQLISCYHPSFPRSPLTACFLDADF